MGGAVQGVTDGAVAKHEPAGGEHVGGRPAGSARTRGAISTAAADDEEESRRQVGRGGPGVSTAAAEKGEQEGVWTAHEGEKEAQEGQHRLYGREQKTTT